MAELSVEISAKIDKLQKELAKAKGEFKALESSAAKTNSKLGKSSSLKPLIPLKFCPYKSI